MSNNKIEEIRQELHQVTDGLGTPIDQGIFEAVVALNAAGLQTSQSCQGHPQEQGHPYPWVEVLPDEPEGSDWWNDPTKVSDMEIRRATCYAKAMGLLSEFYKGRSVPYEIMLGCSRVGWGFRIQSNGAETMMLVDSADWPGLCQRYQNEMDDFARFVMEGIESGRLSYE